MPRKCAKTNTEPSFALADTVRLRWCKGVFITTRKLGQNLNIYEGEGGALICRLLMKHAECSNHFEGLNDAGERCITTKLVLTIEVPYIDESRCALKGITTKEFTVHAGDWIELENKENEIVARLRIKAVNFGVSEKIIKESDVVQTIGGCATDILFDFDVEKGFIDFREK